MLPPGLTGHHDIQVTLLDAGAQPEDALQAQIVDLLRKRRAKKMRGDLIRRAVKHNAWLKAIHTLAGAGIVARESILTQPTTRPRVIQVAALAIPAHRLPDVRGQLGKRSREADLLAYVARAETELTAQDVLDLPDIGRATLDRAVETGLLHVDNDDKATPGISPDALDDTLFELRGGEVEWHILQVLAREGGPMDVSWVYAQTGSKLDDLKRLEAHGLVWLGEQHQWRDSLADREFVAVAPPRLTPAQRKVWGEVRARIVGKDTPQTPPPATTANPTPALPGGGEGARREVDSGWCWRGFGEVEMPPKKPHPSPPRKRRGSAPWADERVRSGGFWES
jgi:hypothetical protein